MALLALWNPNIQFLKTDGTINAGGKIIVTDHNDAESIPANYSDADGTTLNSSPIVLDALGRATCYIDDGSTYDLYVKDANGATLWTVPEMTPGTETIVVRGGFSVSSNDRSVAVTISVDSDGVTNYDLSIQNEIDRATEAEKGLADAIKAEKNRAEEAERTISESVSKETERAIAAEKASRTEIVAGDNITVEKTTGEYGHDIYTINGDKQPELSDGDNVHIDEAMRINVVNRKTLMVKSPLTAEKLATALVIGIRNDAFASAEGLSAETEARTKSDAQLLQRIEKVDSDLNAEIQNRIVEVSKKQDKYYLFNSNTSTVNEVQSAITDGRTIVSSTGSNFVTWQGFIHGNSTDLVRVDSSGLYSWHYVLDKWESEFKKLSMAPTAGKLVVGLNGTETLTYYDWKFAFTLNSLNAANVNIRNPNVTSADIFSETRTYGNSVQLVGADLSSGKDIIYCGNGDFKNIPTRIVMDIFDGTNWLELRMMQYTSGSNLVIDYRIGGFNG